MAIKKIRKTFSLSREVVEYLETKSETYEGSFEVEMSVRAREEFKAFMKNKEKKNANNI